MLKKVKENYGFFLFLLFLLFYIFYLPNALALENNRVDLDFSEIENPWGLTSTVAFEIPENALNKKYYHIQISSKNELNVWYYDEKMAWDPKSETYQSDVDQKIYLDIYLYDEASHNFKFSFTYSYTGNTISKNDNHVIWSSYSFASKTFFPDLTYTYQRTKEFLDTNDILKQNIQYFISKTKRIKGMNFIISLNSFSNHLYLTFAKEPFSVKSDSDGTPRYTVTVVELLMFTDTFTQEYIDDLVRALQDFDSFYQNASGKGNLALPFWEPNKIHYNSSAVLYSSFSKKFTYMNQIAPIFINGIPYLSEVPTMNTVYDSIIVDTNEEFDYTDMPDISTDGEDQEFDATDPDKVIEGNDAKKSMLNLLSFFLDQFPIYKQIRTISERWRYYDPDCIQSGSISEPFIERCYLLENLKFTFLDHEYNLPGLNVTWYLQYRKMIDFFIMLSVGLYTALKCLRIVQGMFHGK